MGEAGSATRNDVEMPRDVELADFEFLEKAMLDFPGDAHAGNDGYTHAHLHETLDAFDRRHFHGHIERSAMAGEKLDDAAAKGCFDDVGDEVFFAEFLDINFLALGEGVLGGNDEGEFVFQDFSGLQLRIAGDVGDGAEIEAVVQDFVRNVAREHAVKADLHAGVGFAELGDGWEQGMDGAFVDAEGEFAALEALEFHKAFLDFVAEVEEAFGVFAEQVAGVGEADRAGSADEEGLAEGVFELADGQADSGLRAIQAFGGAGEAALAGYGEEDLQFA